MDLKWHTVLLCLGVCSYCKAFSAHPRNNGQLEMENGSNLASHNQRPSPIDIETGNLVERDFPPLNNPFANPIFENETVECVNNGMTVSCSINGSSAVLRGGPYENDYIFETMHFHWGYADTNGSEHIIDGHRFASEIHAIFRNQKYPNLTKAIEMDDGLGILAWLGVLREEDNHAMNAIFAMAEKIIEFDTKYTGTGGTLLRFLKELAEPVSGSSNWITYEGALTVEPYPDNVKWIVYDKPYAISHRQLDVFRHLKRADGTPNLEHSMEIASLSGRSIYKPKGGEFDTDDFEHKKCMLL